MGVREGPLFIPIRNITGLLDLGAGYGNEGSIVFTSNVKGAFEEAIKVNYTLTGSQHNGYERYRGFRFSANADTRDYNNLMAEHAVATDSDGGTRPYNISMIPIIIVS